MVTALQDWMDKRQAIETGADDYVEKPFELCKACRSSRAECGAASPARLTLPSYKRLFRGGKTHRIPTVSSAIDSVRQSIQERKELLVLYFNFDRYAKIEEIYGWEKLDEILQTTGGGDCRVPELESVLVLRSYGELHE